jgi:lactate dehydrogenase-like 2-hydroxyacid dehydrogenase
MNNEISIAVLGTGTMGRPIAANLIAAGFNVSVWNRTAARAEPLREDGARLAGSPADAVASADVILTMLADGDGRPRRRLGGSASRYGLDPDGHRRRRLDAAPRRACP